MKSLTILMIILDCLMLLMCVIFAANGEKVSPWMLALWVVIALIHNTEDLRIINMINKSKE